MEESTSEGEGGRTGEIAVEVPGQLWEVASAKELPKDGKEEGNPIEKEGKMVRRDSFFSNG